jgi:cellulose synthase/poly-beta-1,6-N-acetylglucosamine synthase-like glycosyltransferase
MIAIITRGYVSGTRLYSRKDSSKKLQEGFPVQYGEQKRKIISVIIPVRNESANIIPLLEDLSSQDYPADYLEIIIADDFSEDGTIESARQWIVDKKKGNVILVDCHPGPADCHGKKNAIERAFAISKGELVITSDADTRHSTSWVSEMATAFSCDKVQMVLGPVGFPEENSLFQKIQSLELLGIMGVTAGSAKQGFPLMCNGANLAYRSQAFRDVKGFTGNYSFHSGDDQFLMMKFRKRFRGGSIIFLSEKAAIATTSPSNSWYEFYQQRLRWVSKSRGYRDPMVIVAGLLTYGQFVLIFAGLAGSFFNPVLLLCAGLTWFLKIVSEYPLVRMAAGFYGKKKLLKYYLVAQVFQFVYVIVTGLAGQFVTFSWKGRTFRR